MNCKKCGAPITAEQKFCGNCGEIVSAPVSDPVYDPFTRPMEEPVQNTVNIRYNQQNTLHHFVTEKFYGVKGTKNGGNQCKDR